MLCVSLAGFTAGAAHTNTTSPREACPIRVDEWGATNTDTVYHQFIEVGFTNESPQRITYWAASTEALDNRGLPVGAPVVSTYTETMKKGVRPGKEHTAFFMNKPFLKDGSYRLHLLMVRFSDGSVWKATGSGCYSDSVLSAHGVTGYGASVSLQPQ